MFPRSLYRGVLSENLVQSLEYPGEFLFGGVRHVENVVTEDEDRALAGLLTPADRIEVGPANLASQYSGHESSASASP